MYLLPMFDVRDILIEGRASAREAFYGTEFKQADYVLFERALELSACIQEIVTDAPIRHTPFMVMTP